MGILPMAAPRGTAILAVADHGETPVPPTTPDWPLTSPPSA